MMEKLYSNRQSSTSSRLPVNLQVGRTTVDIDARIEALTHSVELLSQMHRDNEKMYAALFKQLATIAASHEDRISDLEDASDSH